MSKLSRNSINAATTTNRVPELSAVAAAAASSSASHINGNIGKQRSKKIKRCCRNFFTFMCTQVGVGALILFYTICGAFSFMHIEREYIDKTSTEILMLRKQYGQELWQIMEQLNTFDRQHFQQDMDTVLQAYQRRITELVKQGYSGRSPEQIWSFPAALMFCLSVITMIGYGNMVPRTPWGKGFTVIYATFGIPLYCLYFLNMGRVLARSFKFLYRSLHDCSQDTEQLTASDDLELGSYSLATAAALMQRKRVIVPSTACLWVVVFYILTGTVMFANWEKWSFLNSFYFCMMSLCKIGFGDFVPGASLVTAADVHAAMQKIKEDPMADIDEIYELQLMTDQNWKLAINFIYMLIGMGLVAMCYNLMREEVRIKLKEMREDTKQCLDDTRDTKIPLLKITIDQFLNLQKRITNFEVMLGGSTEHHRTPSSSTGPFRIFAVAGYQNRTNDIVYCPPIIRQYAKNDEDSTAIVYFGGDVQDFPESMETNRDSRGYMKYNLENSAILLREAFPSSHIIVVRPVRMEFKTFSCFDNFVRGNNAGVPDHTPMNHALQHLECLLQNLSQRLISIPEHEILNQSAQAAAAAATTTTTNTTITTNANATTATPSLGASPNKIHHASSATNTTSLPSSSSLSPASVSALVINNEGSPEMDIDIMHVNDHINVVDGDDGAVIFKHADDNSQTYMNCNNGNKIITTTTTSATTIVSTAAIATTTIATTTIAVTSPITTTTTTTTITNTNNINTNASQNKNDVQYTSNIANNAKNACTMTLQQQQQQNNSHGEYNPLWWRENLNLDKSKLALIGFSKGCVVLNQFIYEFHYLKTLTPDDSSMIRLLSRFTDMYWLDGGHGGQKNTWITSRSLLETLTRMGMNIHVHLTPYQVQDDRRPWIRKEEKIFTDLLKRLGAPITRFLHYDSQTASLMTHFEVLQAFCQHVHAQNSSLINQQQQQKHRQQQLQQQQPAHQTQQQQVTQTHHSPINIINVLTTTAAGITTCITTSNNNIQQEQHEHQQQNQHLVHRNVVRNVGGEGGTTNSNNSNSLENNFVEHNTASTTTVATVAAAAVKTENKNENEENK